MEIDKSIDITSRPLITVIVLTYKNQKRLLDTLGSVLEQTYPNIQLIISDDCSGVFERQKVEQYIGKNAGKNIKTYLIRTNKDNLGTVAHMNLTARLADGEYIKFLACGDAFYQKDSLEQLTVFAQSQKMPIVTSKSAVCSEDFLVIFYEFPDSRRVKRLNEVRDGKLFEVLANSNIISAVGTLFNRRFFEDLGGFDESYRLLEDWPCWLTLVRNGYFIPCLDEVTGYYTDGGVSSKDGTAFESGNLRQDMILCYEKEILPYLNNFSVHTQRYVRYKYKSLKTQEESNKFKRLLFVLKYLPFESCRIGKRIAKKAIKEIMKGIQP